MQPIDYTLKYHVEPIEPPLVDGVELETRAERLAKQAMMQRMVDHIAQQIEDAFYGITRLPPP